ncbi:MAG: Gfo/Idh/MocA family oxidoreductase [Verrucomicrobiales bacterium]|nr:Gfo/Idh/MocA family oxidoreductase [Verrucomicrobiales bacterium]
MNKKVLVLGAGNMGASHAKAYHNLDGFEVAGIVTRSAASREKLAESLGGDIALFGDYDEALAAVKPDCVSINTYPETHAEYAIKAMEAGAHVFLEKPLAPTVDEAQKVVDTAVRLNKKLCIGYILRHHPSWIKFIEIARTLGNPLVMRMNLNQQSHGDMWNTHRNLMNSMSPIVDCGVHYVDVMCQMTQSKPIKVNAIGARLSDELNPGMYNYGQLQVTFENGSVGWYEAGWGPMMSEVAFFVKDVVGPKGCVSIVADKAGGESESSNVDSHTKTEALRVHHAELDENNQFVKEDEIINLEDEPDHDALCQREQAYFLKAIDEDIDLTDHMNDGVNSLRIVLAAEQSFKEGRTIDL